MIISKMPHLKFAALSLILATFTIFLPSCSKKGSDLSKVLYKENNIKAFKDLDADSFTLVFQKLLASKRNTLSNPKLINSYYAQHNYEPSLVLNHFTNKGLKVLPEYLNQASKHGLDPEIFHADTLEKLIDKLYDKTAIRSKEEAYQILADVEMMFANSLINYDNALQFGILSPRKMYANYYTKTKRPDSTTMLPVFAVKDLKTFLDSIQPKDPQYLALQTALQSNVAGANMSQEQTNRVIKANLERLRWKNKPDQEKYVLVNIADFKLDVIDHGKSILNMKVCVGEGRNEGKVQSLIEYDETGLTKDRPFSRETPQLNSLIHSVQVNPVWNIPESIATNEIVKYAAGDKYYLSNKNIDVYKNGKIVENPETIDWSSEDTGKIYRFKQRPGDDNSLGKIKFLFANDQSVYLHDTPAKAAFDLPMRAVSHGCVRVEKPLDLALALFGKTSKFDVIQKEMQSVTPEAKDIFLKPTFPVYLTYVTAWADANGSLQFRKDIYGLDVVLDSYLQKINGAVKKQTSDKSLIARN